VRAFGDRRGTRSVVGWPRGRWRHGAGCLPDPGGSHAGARPARRPTLRPRRFPAAV